MGCDRNFAKYNWIWLFAYIDSYWMAQVSQVASPNTLSRSMVKLFINLYIFEIRFYMWGWQL